MLKTEKYQYFFEVQLNWQEGRKGILTANDVKDTIKVATPAVCRICGAPNIYF